MNRTKGHICSVYTVKVVWLTVFNDYNFIQKIALSLFSLFSLFLLLSCCSCLPRMKKHNGAKPWTWSQLVSSAQFLNNTDQLLFSEPQRLNLKEGGNIICILLLILSLHKIGFSTIILKKYSNIIISSLLTVSA